VAGAHGLHAIFGGAIIQLAAPVVQNLFGHLSVRPNCLGQNGCSLCTFHTGGRRAVQMRQLPLSKLTDGELLWIGC